MRTIAAGAMTLCFLVGGVAGAGAATPPPLKGAVLFTPDPAHPEETGGYPSGIRLEHAGGVKGTLLATFAHAGVPGEKGSLPIYRSTDGGRSWSAQPIGVVRDTVHGWDVDAPALFELPAAQGDLPAGTLFAACTAWNRKDFRQQAMEIFISRDGGANWSYRSSCASEAMQVNNEGHGIWEPFFVITKDGSLLRRAAVGGRLCAGDRAYSQHRRWRDMGTGIFDVAVHDGLARPECRRCCACRTAAML